MKDYMWIEVLAVHIQREGDWYRGEVRRIPLDLGQKWIKEDIVRAVRDPSHRLDLPQALDSLYHTVESRTKRTEKRKPIDLKIDDMVIQGRAE